MRDWLRKLRGNRTQKQIAELSGITAQMYNFIENGHRRPSVAVAKRIARVLGFEWTRFFQDNSTS